MPHLGRNLGSVVSKRHLSSFSPLRLFLFKAGISVLEN